MTENTKQLNIPQKILIVLKQLEQAGYEAFLVGGCVRDLIRGQEPKDWDITTNAKPEQILEVFPDGKYENDFGTVILPEKYITANLRIDNESTNSAQVKDNDNKEQAVEMKNSEQTVEVEDREVETVSPELTIGNVEITTYRIESTYSDRRRPDEVKFAKTLEEDLSRRDFTCNALALRLNFKFKILDRRLAGLNFNSILNDEILNDQNRCWEKYGWRFIDLFGSMQDIENKVIRAVGDPNERFNEDALRMMRAVRFAAQLSEGNDLEFLKDRKGEGRQNQKTEYQVLAHTMKAREEVVPRGGAIGSEADNRDGRGATSRSADMKKQSTKKPPVSPFKKGGEQRAVAQNRWWIGENTFAAIKKNAHLLKHISPERIRDEFEKIILSNRPAWGVELLVETGLMKYIIPEVLDTIGVRQNRHHYYGPFNTVYKHMLAALKTCPSKKLEVRLAAFFHDIGKPKAKRGHGYNSTFYGHEYIGARMTKRIMERLKFSRKAIDKTVLLVKNHMFYYNVDEVGEKGVRKVVRKVGLENINDLIDVRIGDRLGSGVAKAVPYKLRHFKYMVEKVSKDPISVKDLKINGDILLADYNFKPGPQMGAILEILLAEVLDDPKKNTLEYLSDRALELQKEDLQQLRQIAKDKIKEEKQKEEQQTKGKYWVK